MRQPTKEDLNALATCAAQKTRELGVAAWGRAKKIDQQTAIRAAGILFSAWLFSPPEDASSFGNVLRMCFFTAAVIVLCNVTTRLAEIPLQMTDGPKDRTIGEKFRAADNAARLLASTKKGRTTPPPQKSIEDEVEMDRMAREAQAMGSGMTGPAPK